MSIARCTLLVLLMQFPAAAAVAESTPLPAVTGTVYYRERIQLPPGVLVTVRLEDVSRQDAPMELIGQQQFPARTGPPYEFAVEYDPVALSEGHRYALRATLTLDGALMFASSRHYPAFENSLPVDILVRRVSGNPLAGPD